MDKLFAMFLVAAAMAVAVSGFFEGSGMDLRCKGQVIKNTRKMHTHMVECIKEFTALHQNKMAGEKKRGAKCIQLCALKKDGLFDPTGMYQEKKLNDTLVAMLPKVHANTFKEGAATCAHTNNITTVTDEMDDYTCVAYKDFFGCLSRVYIESCTTMSPTIWDEE